MRPRLRLRRDWCACGRADAPAPCACRHPACCRAGWPCARARDGGWRARGRAGAAHLQLDTQYPVGTTSTRRPRILCLRLWRLACAWPSRSGRIRTLRLPPSSLLPCGCPRPRSRLRRLACRVPTPALAPAPCACRHPVCCRAGAYARARAYGGWRARGRAGALAPAPCACCTGRCKNRP